MKLYLYIFRNRAAFDRHRERDRAVRRDASSRTRRRTRRSQQSPYVVVGPGTVGAGVRGGRPVGAREGGRHRRLTAGAAIAAVDRLDAVCMSRSQRTPPSGSAARGLASSLLGRGPVGDCDGRGGRARVLAYPHRTAHQPTRTGRPSRSARDHRAVERPARPRPMLRRMELTPAPPTRPVDGPRLRPRHRVGVRRRGRRPGRRTSRRDRRPPRARRRSGRPPPADATAVHAIGPRSRIAPVDAVARVILPARRRRRRRRRAAQPRGRRRGPSDTTAGRRRQAREGTTTSRPPPIRQPRVQPNGATRPPPATAHAGTRDSAGRRASYSGRNHVWIPSLGINRSVAWFACSRSREPDNYVYRWGCAGHEQRLPPGPRVGRVRARSTTPTSAAGSSAA